MTRLRPYIIILLVALLGLGIIWAFCLNYILKEQERVQIFLTIAVNYLILMAMFVQAYIYKKQSNAMQEQRDVMKGQLIEIKNQVDLAEDALKQTEELINLSERQFYKAHRAYLSVEHISPATIGPNVAPVLNLKVMNGGATPAFNVTCSLMLGIHNRQPIVELEKLIPPSAERSRLGKIIQPNQTASGDGGPTRPFSEDIWLNITFGNQILYVRVDVWFFDIEDTGERHMITWYEWDTNRNHLIVCDI